MAPAPHLTAHRAAHLVFAHVDRASTGTSALRLLNNGGRSRLDVTEQDGRHIPLAPTLHRAIAADVTDAAHRWARAAHGPRRSWPMIMTIKRPTEPLTFEDAAPELGDHVLNGRVYTFTARTAAAARKVMELHPVRETCRETYDAALTVLATAFGIPDRRRAYWLARSYARRHPAAH